MQRRIDPRARLHQHNLYLTCRSRAHRHQYILNSGRPHIHPTQDEQIVRASNAADARTCTSTHTRIRPDNHTITCAESHERYAFTVDVCEDHFTLYFWP